MNRRSSVRGRLYLLTLLATASCARAQGPAWLEDDLAAALAQAKAEQTMVLASVYSETNTWSRKLEADVLSTAEFAEAAEGLVALRVNDDENRTFLKRLGLAGPPALAFLRPDGRLYYSITGYYHKDALVAMVATIAEYCRDDKDPGDLDAAVEAALAAHPEPVSASAIEQTEADQKRTRELLDAAQLPYTQNERGMYAVTVDGCELYANVGGGVMSFQKWWSADAAGDPLALYTRLLRGNHECAIGKFGIGPDGDVWLEQHVVDADLTGATVTEYLRRLAALAKLYEGGGALTAPEPGAGDPAALRAVLEQTGLAFEDSGDGLFTIAVGGEELRVVSREGIVAIAVPSALPDLPDDETRRGFYNLLASADYARYIGKFMLGEEDSLVVGWGVLSEGLSGDGLRAYLEGTAEFAAVYRAAVLTAPGPDPSAPDGE